MSDSVVDFPLMGDKMPAPSGWVKPLSDYLAFQRAAGRPESTIYLRSYHLRRFARESATDPFDVTLDILVEYMGSHAWGKSTQHSVRSTLRGFYEWAEFTKRIDENPAARLPSVTPPPGRPRPASEDAVAIGLMNADERVRLMILLASSAGLRCVEIARVHSYDLFEDLEGWSLRVKGKGGRRRDIPLSRRLALALRALPHGYAFPGQDAGHISAAYVSKLVSGVLPDGVTAHMLRHRFASRAYVGSGRDIRAVQELLGHASVATTQVYTKVPNGALRAGVEGAA